MRAARAFMVTLLALSAAFAWAQGETAISLEVPYGASSVWTAERLLNARPMPLPRADRGRMEPRSEEDLLASAREGSFSSPPGRPSAGITPMVDNFLFDPRRAGQGARSGSRGSGSRSGLRPSNYGLAELDFTSSRLIPEEARYFYPYSTVAKIFFHKPGGGDYVCSGVVISRRIVGTAGHCVYDPDSGFFEDWLIVPAYSQGNAPFGVWEPSYVVVSGSWANGDGVPNDGDFAVFAMWDNQGWGALGNVVGWLGYATNSLINNELTLLGYPANLDRGQRMHQVATGDFDCCLGGCPIYGSDMGGGSSGGPWVQNFGEAAKGQKKGKNKKINRVVGFASFGPNDARWMFQGASPLTSEFKAVFNKGCAEYPGNCSRKGKPKKP